jgi:nucleotide-binding universal stress UspA family protein
MDDLVGWGVRSWHILCSAHGEGFNMINITKVLVATDFSDASEAALLYGREFARTFGAALHVLHVTENPVVWTGADSAGVDLVRMQADIEEGARNALNRTVTAEDRAQLKAVTAVLSDTSPAFAIASYARREGVDIILMGTRGRGMVQHLLMGSVAEKVVRIAPCPVLTVHHPEHEFILPDALEAVGAVKR